MQITTEYSVVESHVSGGRKASSNWPFQDLTPDHIGRLAAVGRWDMVQRAARLASTRQSAIPGLEYDDMDNSYLPPHPKRIVQGDHVMDKIRGTSGVVDRVVGDKAFVDTMDGNPPMPILLEEITQAG